MTPCAAFIWHWACFFICLPTLHPWYLLLLAPLMVVYRSRAWLYLMLATIATLPVLANEYHTGVFQEIKWLKLIEYLPFYSLLIYDTLMRRPVSQPSRFSSARKVSVDDAGAERGASH
jgi:hypothetical protein